MTHPSPLPFLTAGIPGTGGSIKQRTEDFRVEEIPAYEPSGDGDHVIAVIRKRDISTFEAIKRLARALDVKDSDIGSAGLKDRRAVTVQQLSLPPPTTPEAVRALEIDNVEILSAARHPHKLRTGHLRGNKFNIIVRDCELDADDAMARASAILAELSGAPGTPNWFGEQRFGAAGDNAALGRDILLGAYRGKKPRGRILRLYLSSIQSLLFNNYLVARIEAGNYRELLAGDVLKKTDSGGVFVSDDADADAERLRAGAVVATGPMFGPKMTMPAEGSPAAALETEILAAAGLERDAFRKFAKLTPGTRRPLAVALGEVSVTPIEQPDHERGFEVSFSLPSGSYATNVLREIIKQPATSSTP